MKNLPTKENEIFIPANGDCLYTSVFVGYLLPAAATEEQFYQRLSKLFPVSQDHSNRFRIDFIQNLRSIDYLQSPAFRSFITCFKEQPMWKMQDGGAQMRCNCYVML